MRYICCLETQIEILLEVQHIYLILANLRSSHKDDKARVTFPFLSWPKLPGRELGIFPLLPSSLSGKFQTHQASLCCYHIRKNLL